MGVFSDDKREITCDYNSNSSTDKQTVGYLKSSEKSVLTIDISKQKITGTQWAELATRLNTNLKEIIDANKIEGNLNAFSDDDCITILRQNSDVLNGAIVFTEGKASQIKNPSKVLSFFESDSKEIPKPNNF